MSLMFKFACVLGPIHPSKFKGTMSGPPPSFDNFCCFFPGLRSVHVSAASWMHCGTFYTLENCLVLVSSSYMPRSAAQCCVNPLSVCRLSAHRPFLPDLPRPQVPGTVLEKLQVGLLLQPVLLAVPRTWFNRHEKQKRNLQRCPCQGILLRQERKPGLGER